MLAGKRNSFAEINTCLQMYNNPIKLRSNFSNIFKHYEYCT